MAYSGSKRMWTVADAQARLPELLRLAQSEGPQYIGAAHTFVVTPADPEPDQAEPRAPLGQWLVHNVPRGANLEIPRDRSSAREIPFADPKDE